MRKELSDIEIIESVLRGNDNDFSLLVDRYKDKAFNLLSYMLKNQLDAQEVLQDSFLKAYKSLRSFRRESSFSTWFYKIVYNTALTFLNSKRKKIDDVSDSIDDYNYLGAEETVYEKDNKTLNEVVEKLPVKYALVVIMFYLDGMSLSEISTVFNTSISNVKVLLHRARKIMREYVIKHKLQEELL